LYALPKAFFWAINRHTIQAGEHHCKETVGQDLIWA